MLKKETRDGEVAGNAVFGKSSACTPNPRRSAAGKRNQALSRGLTPSGRAKLRATALRCQPWKLSTGPRTAAGKARSARNGKATQIGPRSVRELRADVAELRQMADSLRESRQAVLSQFDEG